MNTKALFLALVVLPVALFADPQMVESFQESLNGIINEVLVPAIIVVAMVASGFASVTTGNFKPLFVGTLFSGLVAGGLNFVRDMGAFPGELAPTSAAREKPKVQVARELTPFEKLVKQQGELTTTLKRLNENIASIKEKLRSNKALLKEKTDALKAYAKHKEDGKEHIYRLKKENVVRLGESSKRLAKELAINKEKAKGLSEKVAYFGEYIQEIKDAKAINAALPKEVLEIESHWLSYERLYEEIERELAGETAKGETAMELNETSGRVNGINRLNGY